MQTKSNRWLLLLSTVLFTFLFHDQDLGLNLFIYEMLLIAWFLAQSKFQFNGFYQKLLGIGLILSAVFTIVTHSTFVYVLNFISLYAFIGSIIFPEAKSILQSMHHALYNISSSQGRFVSECLSRNKEGKKRQFFVWRYRMFILPLFIISIFIAIYSSANPAFQHYVEQVSKFLEHQFNWLYNLVVDLNFSILVTLFVGLFLSNFFFLRSRNKRLVEKQLGAKEDLFRLPRKKRNSKFNALRNEYKSGVFLLVILNILLVALNIIDLDTVWLHFEWNGNSLKQFVHEGTYLLILSILISIALVLYYFRGNINFYAKNSTLKLLSYIWIIQNGLLALSVAMRNYWYIKHFALAYKRIGVFIFLLLTLYGLYTVFSKVSKRKSSFYLFKKNALAIYLILLVCSFINWDVLIARYNFSHANKSFLHLNYLSHLSNKALPALDKPMVELIEIDVYQKSKFSNHQIIQPIEYHDIIQARKEIFIKKWKDKNILEWNLAEYRAYKKMKAPSQSK